MDVGFWRTACQHFDRILKLPSTERASYLGKLEEGMRRGVESLMKAEAEADDFLEAPALSRSLAETLKGAAGREPSLRLGPYLLERELSRGGMSRVFLARRGDGEYDKEVVVKIIAREMASEDLVVRFRRERQILATLDHPNIARLLDGGSTEEGLPYLVMEYVEGTPIDEYCDGERLSTRERLELMLDVCGAVDYAHGQGVIHRDLKPANILVSEAGVPKLLDFGIAKLGERHHTWFDGDGTSPDASPMTPCYASPEQVAGESITRATDVYSLGVVLYKLLSGQLPYLLAERTPEAVKAAVLEQAAESLPLAASRGWAGATAGTFAVTRRGAEPLSAARRTTPEGLRRALSGDLDAIVRMALRKEPERRYGTVRELEEDLRRHLEGFPVMASGDAVGEPTAKYLQRNTARIAVAVVGAGALAITTGIWRRSQSLREEPTSVRPIRNPRRG